MDHEIPTVTWEDIGGLKELKERLNLALEGLKDPTVFSRIGLSIAPHVILLHGPPGCGKTMLFQAMAHIVSPFELSPADLYGEGEAYLRDTFRRARLAGPSVILIDSVDSVFPLLRRGNGPISEEASFQEKLKSVLLQEMNFLKDKVFFRRIIVLATTIRPYGIDEAIMRNFDWVLYVPPPNLEARYEILRIFTGKMAVADDVNLKKLAEETDCFTGADLMGVCSEAGIVAMRENISATKIYDRHFRVVIQQLRPSLNSQEIEAYASFTVERYRMRLRDLF